MVAYRRSTEKVEAANCIGERWRGGGRGGAVDVLSWTTEAGRRFKQGLCGRVCEGEVAAVAGAVGASDGALGQRLRIRWSGGVVEIPRGIPE